MTKKTYLDVVSEPHPQASIIAPRKMPGIVGGDPSENLACGGCKKVLGKHVSTEAIAAQYRAPYQLVFKCPSCATYNLIPGAANH